MRVRIDLRLCLAGLVVLLICGALARAAEGGGASRKGRSAGAQVTADAMQLLQANCVSCHNADKAKGGLRLTSRSTLLKGRDQIEMCRNCSEGTKVWG